ncbi:MAG: MFS transporter [Promethearchaeota archaeon]
MSTGKMLCYSLPGITSILIFQGILNTVQFFAVSVLLIPWSLVSIVFLIYSINNGLNDPVIGYLCDRSTRFTRKYGKRFPWICMGALLSPIMVILIFVPVTNIKVDADGDVINIEAAIIASIWLCIVLCIQETFGTIRTVNGNALGVDLFRDAKQRAKVGGISTIMSIIGMLIATGFLPIILAVFGGENDRNAYLYMVIVIVIFIFILTIPYLWVAREPDEMKKFRAELDELGKSYSPFLKMIPRVLTDRNWMAIIIAYLGWSTAMTCTFTGINFYVMHALGLGVQYTVMPLLLASLIAIFSAPIWIKLSKKIGASKTYLIGLIIACPPYFFFYFVNDLTGAIIAFAMGGFGYGANNTLFGVVSAQAIDNASIKSGVREEASYQGIFLVFSAFSRFFQTLIFTIVAIATGYVASKKADQTALAKWGLNLQMSLFPLVIMAIAMIVYALLYNISDEQARLNKEKLIEIGL